MTKNFSIKFLTTGTLILAVFAVMGIAQVTTSEITGNVSDQAGASVVGATVTAVHGPSGTRYTTTTNSAGRYTLPAVRIGGPYTVSVNQTGFASQTRDGIQAGLGGSSTVDFTMGIESIGAEVTVTSDDIFNDARTGASTSIKVSEIGSLPTLSRSITDFTRLSPQAGRGGSFAGQDNRANNITVDGSYFNNSFGLRTIPGATSGVSPISLDAIEEVQVNVAPYDVRQGNFVGAGVNTVTRSGTNDYRGSVYYNWQTPGLVGKEAGAARVDPGNFEYRLWGFRVGGPLPFFNFGENDGPAFISGKDKLFFFFSFEDEERSGPGTTWKANRGGEPVGGNTTRVLASDLDALSNFLRTNFGYETGPYEGYTFTTPGRKYLGRVDYNINDKNKVNFRYLHLDSSTDRPLSGSSSLGVGRPNGSQNFLSYETSTYKILENIRSFVSEWSSIITPTISNSLIVGYTEQDESRGPKGTFFPFVDIRQGGITYTSFGFEPFTPNNELYYDTFQIQDNLTFYRGKHTITAGVSFEKYKSTNVFFPGSQSAYAYNSLQDFYDDANAFLNGTPSPVTVSRFQVRYSNIPGLDKPIQPLKVNLWGFYGQDVWRMADNFTLTFGLRADIPFFGETGFTNPAANALSFRDETGASVQYQTQKLPDANILWSPRVGFNWSPLKSDRLQVRGGSGVFSGKPAYVWISNQIGQNGLLTGFTQADNTMAFPFNPNPDFYKPAATGAPAPTYELNFTQPDFRFPQLWRSNIGADVRIPFGLVAGAEFVYSRDVNGIYYTNENLPAAQSAYTGIDNRPRWTSNRIHSNISGAYVLKNQNVGRGWHMAYTLEKPYSKGFYGKFSYSYGENKNTIDPGSIASGSWQNNRQFADPNNPALTFSSFSPGHRFFGAASYRLEYFGFGATTFSAFWETRTAGVVSYGFSFDANGDGANGNDLIYIPRDASEMNFEQYTAGGRTYTVAEQQAAFESFINGSKYLSSHRGQYAERNAAFLPLETRVDFGFVQEVFVNAFGRKHQFQFNANVLNFGNLLNKNWGQGVATTTTTPLNPRGADANGALRYRMNAVSAGGNLFNTPLRDSTGLGDVYRVSLGVRYIF